MNTFIYQNVYINISAPALHGELRAKGFDAQLEQRRHRRRRLVHGPGAVVHDQA